MKPTISSTVELYQRGVPVPEIASLLGSDDDTVRRRLQQAGVDLVNRGSWKLSPAEIRQIVALYQSGRSIRQVASACGVARGTVRYHLAHHDIPMRPARRPRP